MAPTNSGENQAAGRVSPFNGNKARNTLVGLGVAVVVLSQTFTFINGIIDKVSPQPQPVLLSNRTLQDIMDQMKRAQTQMEPAAGEIHDIKLFTERLTKAIETLTQLQESGALSRRNIESDVGRVLKNQKDILDDISEIKKKIAR